MAELIHGERVWLEKRHARADELRPGAGRAGDRCSVPGRGGALYGGCLPVGRPVAARCRGPGMRFPVGQRAQNSLVQALRARGLSVRLGPGTGSGSGTDVHRHEGSGLDRGGSLSRRGGCETLRRTGSPPGRWCWPPGRRARYAMALGVRKLHQPASDRAGVTGTRVKPWLASTRCGCSIGAASYAASSPPPSDRRDPHVRDRTARSAKRLNTSAQQREYALLDYDDKRVTASLRISPHYYNIEEEMDQALSAIRELPQGAAVTARPMPTAADRPATQSAHCRSRSLRSGARAA